MKTFAFPGGELRERRERFGLSTRDMSERIAVRTDYVEAIERGDLAALPEPCYAIGFLRSYCQALDLDPRRYLDSYRACARPRSRGFFRGRIRRAPWPPAWLQEAATWAVITAALLMGWLAYEVVFRPAPPEEQRVEASTVSPTTLAPPSPAPARDF